MLFIQTHKIALYKYAHCNFMKINYMEKFDNK